MIEQVSNHIYLNYPWCWNAGGCWIRSTAPSARPPASDPARRCMEACSRLLPGRPALYIK